MRYTATQMVKGMAEIATATREPRTSSEYVKSEAQRGKVVVQLTELQLFICGRTEDTCSEVKYIDNP